MLIAPISIILNETINSVLTQQITFNFLAPIILMSFTKVLTISLLILAIYTNMLWSALICQRPDFLKKNIESFLYYSLDACLRL